MFDNGSLLAEFLVKPTWIDHFLVKQLVDDSLIRRFRLVKKD